MLAGVKTCPRCRQELPLAEFNFKNRARGRRQVYCRACSRAYIRDHYTRNRQYYIDKAFARKGRELPRLHELVILPETGHMGPVERPDEVAAALLALSTAGQAAATGLAA